MMDELEELTGTEKAELDRLIAETIKNPQAIVLGARSAEGDQQARRRADQALRPELQGHRSGVRHRRRISAAPLRSIGGVQRRISERGAGRLPAQAQRAGASAGPANAEPDVAAGARSGVVQPVAEQIMNSPLFSLPAVKCESHRCDRAVLEAYRDMIWGMRWLLTPAVLVTLVLVIANAISISVRERGTEMAMLKVLGFRPGHILMLVLGEALVIGAIAGFASAAGGLCADQRRVRRIQVSRSHFFRRFSFRSMRCGGASASGRWHVAGRQHSAGLVGVLGQSFRSVCESRLKSIIAMLAIRLANILARALRPARGAAWRRFALLACLGKVPLNYNLRNLIVRWRTTLLTALAFTLVIGLMIVMLAFVNGMSRLTEQSGQPGNVIVLSDGAIDELFSNFEYTETSDVERQPGVLRDENNQPLCSRETYLVAIQDTGTIEGQSAAAALCASAGHRRSRDGARGFTASACYPGGQWFSEAGVQTIPGKTEGNPEAIQAVLGEGIAREMGRDRGQESLKVGDLFELGGRTWIVVGITKSEGSTFGSEVWAKWSLVSHLFGKERYTSMVVRTADAASAKALADDLTTNFKKAALQATPETEYFERLNETSKQFMVAIMFVTGVMSIGGIFGVMNTMFAAVSARSAISACCASWASPAGKCWRCFWPNRC